MTLVRRFMTLARADAHGVLDSLEDSALVLRQCLREAELELVRRRQRLEELGRWQEQLEHATADLVGRAGELEADIQLALAGDEEELARFAIRRLLALRRRERVLAEQRAEVREERERLAEEFDGQERELAELRERVQTHLAEERARRQLDPDGCEDGDFSARSDEAPIHDEEVDLELLRRRGQRAGGAPA